MLSDFFDEDPLPGSWEKVTKRMVDPITFACNVNVAYIPRIEDCSYETNNIAIAQPRFGDPLRSTNVPLPPPPPPPNGKHHTQSTNNDDDRAWIPHDFSPQLQTKKSVQSNDIFSDFPGTPTKSNASKGVKHPAKKNLVSATKSGGTTSKGGASLGAFFSKSIVEKAVEEADNQSLGSRSMSSRSVSDRSHAERSKSEQSLKSRAHERRAMLESMKKGEGMSSIDETDTIEKKGGALGQFLVEQSVEATIKLDDDNRSTMSASTMSISLLSNADRSKTERKLMSSASLSHAEPLVDDSKTPPASPPRRVSLRLKPIKSCILSEGRKGSSLKLQFQDETDCCEVPTLSDKFWYEFWDDIWYSEEELSDFRYAAFLEEAGLDASEFM
eukprot:Nitzschia sp. Nitz4//scaffold7_size249615//94663//95817//NITZ4_001165-RA/size249615-processed-gene-0.137-mRNA-1//1//CDS//3329558406//7780//frame0